MSSSHRDDRPALIALGLILAAIVLVSGLGLASRYLAANPLPFANGSAAQYADGQRGPSEGHWWPEFSARDTYAQWAMTGLAFVATIISVVSVFLIRQTFIETKRTADAAVDSNATTREIGEAQTRAYLSPGVGTFRVTLNGATLKIEIGNFGQSPAQEVDIWARLMMPNMNSSGNHDQLLYSEWRRAGIVGIGAGQTGEAWLLFANGSAPKEIFRSMHTNTFYVSAECRMEWTDVFDKKWPANFFVSEAVDEQVSMNALGDPRMGNLRSTQTPHVQQPKG